MSSIASVIIHSSQFAENVRRDLLKSLHTRCVNHKFHYDSIKQTQKWLALHEAYSPARSDKDCISIYKKSFEAVTKRIAAANVHLIGLGCGGGQKDTQLLKLLRKAGKRIFYTPTDVSVAMTLVARKAALCVVPEKSCLPLVCDLVTADDMSAVLKSHSPIGATQLLTFFGMIPNFEPQLILPKLAALIRRNDWLLFSANLAPGPDYTAGMKKILPQYDNALTRDWLMTFLLDLGVERNDGELIFSIENGGFDLKQVIVRFRFLRSRHVQVAMKMFEFRRGDVIQLFFSYRYTPERVCKVLGKHGLEVQERWVAESGEEGVFLCRKK